MLRLTCCLLLWAAPLANALAASCDNAAAATDITVDGGEPAQLVITGEPRWPALKLVAGEPGPARWTWSLSWRSFHAEGVETSADNRIEFADRQFASHGGRFRVAVGTSAFCIRFTGTNPSRQAILAHVASMQDAKGFDRILQRESRMQQFDENGEPLTSGDNGYGIAQLTNPPPTYAAVWNWRVNVTNGVDRFLGKLRDARDFLSQYRVVVTPDQLEREALARWNGGRYYEWNGRAWQRVNILCDGATSNVGWDMSVAVNQGLTEQQLHARDQALYWQLRPPAGSPWRRYGVCYADGLLR